ncbi:cadherin-like domain-containing protein [Bradyrhizobium lablabi]|uniref:calcium-binding protein n=1 Tax=Bradyrhizobium lablabi TaxID=722472 RepID=UPI001BACB838|nr:cadherin-like domain-containing protein [Bradyrhizobium lablabi]MBR1123480.1 cadherin-like domain-containing protein [Bradyrhizobium lablabi]
MITAKAFRPASQSASRPTREDYAESDQKKGSFLPLAFLVFLTGCAAYLKSFLPVKLEAGERQQEVKREDADQSDAPREDQISAATEEDIETESRHVSKSSDNVVPIRLFRESDGQPAVGPGSIQPASAAPPRVANTATADAVRGGNDNRQSAQPNSGGEGNGGGGGGGGGSEKPRAPTEEPRNRAPRTNGPVQLADVVGCQTVMMIPLLTLLAGTTDPDGDRLTITSISSTSGTLTPTEDGGWIFERDDGMRGDVTLTYMISDGSMSIKQTAYFSVVDAPPIIGTANDDNLLGTQCSETIDGLAGNDNIDARGGNDIVIGGAGDDHIIAGAGNDVVYAGAGNDIVFAGSGNDIIFGGTGNDRLYGEEGDDIIVAEDGDDSLSGGDGADILLAGSGHDTVQGEAGNDTLDGGDGSDNLAGGAGRDTITAGAGNDLLLGDDGSDVLADGAGSDTALGGAGNDHVLAAADAAADTYNGGADRDTIDYSAATESVRVDVGSGIAVGDDIGHDEIAEFEVVIGGSGDDAINASAASTDVSMSGGAGNDALDGGAGNDTLSDGAGVDTVAAGDGDDHVVAAMDAANDSYDGGNGHDRLDYSTATLSVTVDLGRGTANGVEVGHDLIAAFEEVIAGSGNDHVVAGSTSVSMTGGDGDDTFEFHRKNDDHEAMTVRKITDFTVGDRIVAATFEISYSEDGDFDEAISDMFEDIYLSSTGGRRPVRFRFEETDNDKRTMVDIHDRPDTDEFFTIELSGHHNLQFTVAVS